MKKVQNLLYKKKGYGGNIMEFKTAEERVLWELEEAENKVEELKDANLNLQSRLNSVSEKYEALSAVVRKYLKKDNSYFSMYVSTYIFSGDTDKEDREKELAILDEYATLENKSEQHNEFDK